MSSVKEEINTSGNDNIVEVSTPPLDKVRKRVLYNVSLSRLFAHFPFTFYKEEDIIFT